MGAAVLPAAAASASAACALARDDGDHRGHDGRGDGNLAAGDRAGECRVVFAASAAAGTAGADLLNFILAGDQAGDDERLVELRAAACAQGEGFAAGIAWAGNADGECARRAALVAARLKQNLVDNQRGTVAAVCVGAAEMRRIAQQRMFPLRIRAV